MKENTRKSNSDFKKSFQGLQDEAIVIKYKQNLLRDVNSSIAVFWPVGVFQLSVKNTLLQSVVYRSANLKWLTSSLLSSSDS